MVRQHVFLGCSGQNQGPSVADMDDKLALESYNQEMTWRHRKWENREENNASIP